MEFDLDKIMKLNEEQRSIVPHLLLIEQMEENPELANQLLRQTYYGAWGEHYNGRNQ